MAHIKRFEEFTNESLENELPSDQPKPTRKVFIPFNKGKKVEEYLTPEQIEKMKEFQFKPGDVPFNKGKNLEDYVSPKKIEKIKKTQFKAGIHTGEKSASWKGGIQHNKRDGKHIHTGNNERKRIARYNYENAHGEIPAGWIIYHIDKDMNNDEIDNLIAVPRSVLMRLNSNRMNSNYHEIKTAVEDYLSKQTPPIIE